LENLEALKDLLSTSKKVVIIPHINPDGDALGSCLGWTHYLQKKGLEASVISPNEFPAFYDWMPGADKIVLFSKNQEQARKLIRDAHVIFFLDYNDIRRIGEMKEEMENLTSTFVMVDHHRQPTDFAQIMISNPEKSSTSEMIFDLIRDLGDLSVIDQNIGECLYTGMLTDTGSFRFGSTTQETHLAAAHLLSVGVRPDYVYNLVYDTNTLHRIHLMGFTLVERLKTLPGIAAAYITLSEADQKRFHFQTGDSEGFVNYGLSISGIQVSGFFRESEGFIKVSLRSKGDFDVNLIARQYFNGGGHRNAAGGRLDMSLTDAVALFTEVMNSYKNELALK
jgi:phosphoesterase RecJ-like protein